MEHEGTNLLSALDGSSRLPFRHPRPHRRKEKDRGMSSEKIILSQLILGREGKNIAMDKKKLGFSVLLNNQCMPLVNINSYG